MCVLNMFYLCHFGAIYIFVCVILLRCFCHLFHICFTCVVKRKWSAFYTHNIYVYRFHEWPDFENGQVSVYVVFSNRDAHIVARRYILIIVSNIHLPFRARVLGTSVYVLPRVCLRFSSLLRRERRGWSQPPPRDEPARCSYHPPPLRGQWAPECSQKARPRVLKKYAHLIMHFNTVPLYVQSKSRSGETGHVVLNFTGFLIAIRKIRMFADYKCLQTTRMMIAINGGRFINCNRRLG